jgi:hypothetical protein
MKEIRCTIMVCAALATVWAALSGCMSGNNSVVTDVSPKGWNTPAEMVYSNRDTLSERMAVLFLRHDQRTHEGKYAVEFRAPSGNIAFCDTVSVGTPNTHNVSISIPPTISFSVKWPYRRRLRLTEEGDYRLTVTPLQNVRGIWSVGIVFNVSVDG